MLPADHATGVFLIAGQDLIARLQVKSARDGLHAPRRVLRDRDFVAGRVEQSRGGVAHGIDAFTESVPPQMANRLAFDEPRILGGGFDNDFRRGPDAAGVEVYDVGVEREFVAHTSPGFRRMGRRRQIAGQALHSLGPLRLLPLSERPGGRGGELQKVAALHGGSLTGSFAQCKARARRIRDAIAERPLAGECRRPVHRRSAMTLDVPLGVSPRLQAFVSGWVTRRVSRKKVLPGMRNQSSPRCVRRAMPASLGVAAALPRDQAQAGPVARAPSWQWPAKALLVADSLREGDRVALPVANGGSDGPVGSWARCLSGRQADRRKVGLRNCFFLTGRSHLPLRGRGKRLRAPLRRVAR